jgi:polysaccharide biosynthesis transport protein|tara:strand:- start:24898 stop:26643 length:1746 start_codon:yes stop_codon:yes gene_type:complete
VNANKDTQLDTEELIGMIKRRGRPALVAFMLVVILSVVYAIFAPPTFRSESTILIEQQEIPKDLVRSTVTSFADQRIQMIIQRVMTYSKLVELIKKYDLYAKERESEPLESVVNDMRDDIHHRMISADVVDPRSGRPVEATIAFNIGYESRFAKTSQLVANELTSLFLSENIKTRQEMADNAESFFADEVQRLKIKSAELESRLAEFKEKNFRKLPELTPLNMNLMDRTEREYFETNRQIQALEERRIYLESNLSQQDPQPALVGKGQEAALTPTARARLLQNQYVTLLATYSESHPDVIRTKRELENLIGDDEFPNERTFVKRQLEIYSAELTGLRQRYGVSHPDVARLQALVDSFQHKLAVVPEVEQQDMESASNPSYVQLATALKSVRLELESMKATRDKLKAKLHDLEMAIIEAPMVEKEYLELTRDYENTTRKYQELRAKQSEAGLARTLEQESKGERFTLIQPPLMPERPISPNRILILIAGFIVAIVIAVGVIIVLEKMDPTFYSARVVTQLLGKAPLVTVQHIRTPREVAITRRSRVVMAGGLMLACLGVAIITHIAWMPLDVLWYVALRKIG